MISQAPPTPPMSETNVLGVAASVLEISDLAAKVSVRLLTLSRKTKDAIKPIEALSKDVAATGAVLHQLGRQLKKDEDVQVGSSTLATTVDDLVEECSKVFDSIDKALDGNTSGSKAILGLLHYVQFASLEPEIALLDSNLERLRTPLALMLNVLIYAEQLRNHENKSLLKEQQDLIRFFNEERKDKERRFHKLTAENKAPIETAPAAIAPWEELSPIPELPQKESAINEAPEKKANDEVPGAKERVWIKSDSPEPEDQPAQSDSVPSRNASTTGQRSIRSRGRIRNLFRSREVEEDEEDHNRDSLLDMASFLKSTGPDTRDSGEDGFIFNRPVKISTSRPRYEARDPIVRADSSDLINFFREGSPRALRNGSARTQGSTTSSRRPNEPMTPPLTAREDNEKPSPLPSQGSPIQALSRSHSTALSSPLASHPPEPQIDTSRPATTKWPLQAVLTWLENNSFSPEWQQTFRVLQIEGSDFIELESGQSIRKMLTIVYPQLTRECTESGKGWDKARERVEGQRLRKLIRELPVDVKYEELASTPEKAVNVTAASQLPAKGEPTLEGGDRTVAPSSSTEVTSTKPTPQVPIPTDLNHEAVSPLSEQDEKILDMQTSLSITKRPDTKGHGRNVSDEWVKRWTVLSPEEIARGREPVSPLAEAFTL